MNPEEENDEQLVSPPDDNLTDELKEIADDATQLHKSYVGAIEEKKEAYDKLGSREAQLRAEYAASSKPDKQRKKDFDIAYGALRDEIVATTDHKKDILNESNAHYKGHETQYQDMALTEAAQKGTYVHIGGRSNLEELINNGVSLIPGLSSDQLRELEDASKISGSNYVGALIDKLKSSAGTPEDTNGLVRDSFRSAILHSQCQEALSKLGENYLSRGLSLDSLTIDNLPKMRELADSLGISPEKQDLLFRSWNTYNRARKDEKTIEGEARSKYLKDKSDKLVRDMLSVTQYIESYGMEEFNKVMDTFGVTNFSRYPDGLLHDQLVRWGDGKDLPNNVVIAGRTDWNGAFNRFTEEVIGAVDPVGTYFFEANDELQIARHVVSVGNRERRNGRNPEETNSIKSLILVAHGAPFGMGFGTSGEVLSVGDYVKDKSLLKTSINNYRRHLGSGFQLILCSCSTADTNGWTRNIAETISDEHDVKVSASTAVSLGIKEIRSNGEVIFLTSDNGDFIPASTLDGSGGSGVEVDYTYSSKLARWKSVFSRLKKGRLN